MAIDFRSKAMSVYVGCLVLIFFAVPASSQHSFENAIRFPETEALENQTIKKIVEGPLGFVWIATDEHLYRFDGTLLTPLFKGHFEDIDVDTTHKQLIFTSRENLIFYAYHGDSTEIISNQRLTGGDYILGATLIFNDSIYWIGSEFGLTRIYRERGQVDSFPVYTLGNEFAQIRDLTRDPLNPDILWLGSKYGLFSFNITTGEYDQHRLDYFDKDREIALNSFDCLYAHRDGKIYCGSWGTGMAIYNPATGRHDLVFSELTHRNASHVYSIISETDSILWISTTTGSAKYNPYTGDIQAFLELQDFPSPELDIGPVMIDKKGRYWIGYTNGLRVFDPRKSQIQNMECPLMKMNRHYIPRRVSYNENPNLLYITVDFGEGLYTYDISRNIWNCVTPNGYTPNQQFRAMDSYWQNDTLWILESDALYYYKSGSDNLTKYPFDYDKDVYRFRSFAQLDDGNIGIISSVNGLYIAEPVRNTIRHYSHINAFSGSEFLKYVKYIHVDLNGMVWLGYKDHLYLYLEGESRFIDATGWINHGEPFLDLYDIFEDHMGVWLTTETGIYQIQYISEDQFKSRIITRERALSAITDDDGDLWLASGQNLLKLGLENGSLQRFTSNDGLPETTRQGFEVISKISDGRIFLCARKKFAVFHPDEFLPIPENPVPYFVNVYVNGVESKADVHNLSLSDLRLNPYQNTVAFNFSAISYSSQINNKFRYKLEGVNEDWIVSSSRNISPTYANLQGGEYRFLVQATGIDNHWSAPAAIHIHASDFFWRRSWFQILIVLVGLSAILALHQIRLSRLRKQNSTKLQIINLEKKALQAQMNPHFLFNAMNSIQHLIGENQDKKAMLYLNKFGKLLRSVLDSSGSSFVRLQSELEMLENYILLESLRFEGAFQYELKVDESLEYHDIKIPGFILQPIVENAIQHGLLPGKGEGLLKITLENQEKYVNCIIEDNGVGRSATKDNQETGSHQSVGLALLRTRLNLLNTGNLKDLIVIDDLFATHGAPAGTRVTIKLPVQ